MPYRPYSEQRDKDEHALRSLALRSQGDLTWAIAILQDEWAAYQADLDQKQVRYTILSQARAAAQDAADEWYAQVMRPYEDQMRARNGSPYETIRRLLPQSL